MARLSEHIIERTIYNQKNLSIRNISNIFDAQNRNILDLINDPYITNDITYKMYTYKKRLFEKYRDDFLDRYENIKQNLSNNPLANQYYSESFHKKLPCKCMEIPLSQNVIHIEKFLAKNLNFSLTSENEINEYFDISLINDSNGELKITTFKDNTNNSCSDKIILFNLSMMLVVNEITATPLPFSILNKSINISSPKNHCSGSIEINTHRLFSVYNVLSNIEVKYASSLFSTECILLFYAHDINCNADIFTNNLRKMKKYLEREMDYVVNLCRNSRFDFLIIFLPYLGFELESPCNISPKMISDYYRLETEKYSNLITDINSSSNALFEKYCCELPNLIEKKTFENAQEEINEFQNEIHETANNISHYFEVSSPNNRELKISNYLTILTNLSSTNNVKQFVEILFNICFPGSDNISDLSNEIFFHNYTLLPHEYNSESKGNLYDILYNCQYSLLDIEVLAGLLSILIYKETDWSFIYSILSAQTDDPVWYKSFYEIVKLIRGSDYVEFVDIKTTLELKFLSKHRYYNTFFSI